MDDKMEQWEIDLRTKLEKELPDGQYQIGGGAYIMWTGKQGKIESEVALHKELQKLKPQSGYSFDIESLKNMPPPTEEQIANFKKIWNDTFKNDKSKWI